MLNYEMIMLIIIGSIFLILELVLVFRNKTLLSMLDAIDHVPETTGGFFIVNLLLICASMFIGLILTGILALMLEVPKVLIIICAVIIVKIIFAQIFLRGNKSKINEED